MQIKLHKTRKEFAGQKTCYSIGILKYQKGTVILANEILGWTNIQKHGRFCNSWSNIGNGQDEQKQNSRTRWIVIEMLSVSDNFRIDKNTGSINGIYNSGNILEDLL